MRFLSFHTVYFAGLRLSFLKKCKFYGAIRSGVKSSETNRFQYFFSAKFKHLNTPTPLRKILPNSGAEKPRKFSTISKEILRTIEGHTPANC